MTHPWHGCSLDPAEQLLAAMVKQALADARQTHNPRLQREALQWLWQCCPIVAQTAQLPPVALEASPIP